MAEGARARFVSLRADGNLVHNETPDMDNRSNWLKRVHDHTGVMPGYGCLTYDFDDDPFPDTQWNEGVKQMWDRGLLVALRGFGLYEQFRPKIPEGVSGWGAKGEPDLGGIRKLAVEK